MPTLISTHNSSGSTGRCDAKCYNAEHPHCECCCGGVNHGVGLRQAIHNTEAIAQEMCENLTTDSYPIIHDVQLQLFDGPSDERINHVKCP